MSQITCPSYVCKPGAGLLGIVDSEGIVRFTKYTIKIDPVFVAEAKKQIIPPEFRFRFSGPCITDKCENWKIDHCGLAKKIVSEIFSNKIINSGSCMIKDCCRWRLEHNDKACRVCPTKFRGADL